MKQAIARSGALCACAVLLLSCGGGGGGDSGGNDDPHAGARLELSTRSVSASGTPGDLAPEQTFTFVVTNNPPAELYIDYNHSTNGVYRVEFEQTGPAEGTMKVVFHEAGSLLNNTYADTIEIHLCFDIQCRTEVKNSPATVATTYVVSGDGPSSASLSQNSIELTADQREDLERRQDLIATIDVVPPAGLHIQTSFTSNAVKFVARGAVLETTQITVGFNPGSQFAVGSYDDTVTIKLCYAENCVRQIGGSPFTVSTTLNVTLGVEPGLPQLQFLSRQPLGHDVIDAAYSAAMNAVVMVGSSPANALYVYDIDDATERSQPLTKLPTALSVSPDGLIAAVGHDAFISVVNLATVGDAAAPAPTVLNVSIPVYDIAIDGNGHVYAVPIEEISDNIYAIDIATNTEQQTPASVEKIAVHPGAQSLYGLPDSPVGDLRKWDISSGVPSYLYAYQYQFELRTCMNYWFSEIGDRIYTACGETFSASANPSEDMIRVGTIPLTEPVSADEHYIRSLSHSAADHEIALVEWQFFDCIIGPLYSPCYTHLAYVDDATLNQTAIFSIGPVTTGGSTYVQRGRYVFHDEGSTHKILITELEEPPSNDQRYWLNVIP